jgi:hypothetical protein
VIDNDETEPIVEVAPETPDIIVPEDPTGVTKIDVVVPSDVTDATVNVASLVNTGSSGVNNATLPARINITATTAIGQVFVDIPSNTVVSGDNWNGIINVPTIKPTNSVTVIPSTGNVVEEVLTVIEIRFDDIQLEFDNAVRILIPDMAGNLVGYSRADTSTPIDHIYESDSQAAGDALSDGGDCKIDAGDDLAVWTKHFTSFVVYNEAPVSSDDEDEDDDGSGGGGGGGGGSLTVSITWPPSVDTFPESYFDVNPLAIVQVSTSAFLNAGGVSINRASVGQ